jgi:hypothetical protein
MIFEVTEAGFPSDQAVRIFVQFDRTEAATKVGGRERGSEVLARVDCGGQGVWWLHLRRQGRTEREARVD